MRAIIADAFGSLDGGLLVSTLFALFIAATIVYRALRTPAVAMPDDDAVRCPTCGYDLRATGDRCPECGELMPRVTRVRLDPAKLRDDWPTTPIDVREPAADETPVTIWHAPHAMAATLLVEQLRVRGVKAIVRTTQRPMRVGQYTPTGDDHAVAIWSDDADRVEHILDGFVARATRP